MVVVAGGSWVYAGEVVKAVDIVGLNYDFWYELALADGRLEPGEAARPLGADGLLYYVRFRHAGRPVEATWPDSAGHDTIEAAQRAAESRVTGPISWDR